MPSTHRITASAHIDAPASPVYAIIADYQHGHPQILPDAYRDLEVERGGVGAGTIIRCSLRPAGRTNVFRAAVTEPEPGRVLVDSNLEGQRVITTFTVDPTDEGRSANVTTATEFTLSMWPLGAMERFV